MASMDIDRIDHVVLTVFDLERTIRFYEQVMGMTPVEFGGRRALRFGRQKINLHLAGKEFEPKALKPGPGTMDLCFVTETPIEKVMERLKAHEVAIIEGPVERTGAIGRLRSVYFRDPDGNLIEVSNSMETGTP